MVCLYCQQKTHVNNSRPKKRLNQLWRRRQCLSCAAIFTTVERIDLEKSLSVKHPEGLEPFLWQKLFISMYESLKHTRNPEKTAHDLLETVITSLVQKHGSRGFILPKEIIQVSAATLARYDQVAGAHYRALHSIDNSRT